MPFVLLILGVVFLVSSVKGTQGQLGTLLQGDFTGQNNFVYWVVVILLIGSLGYIPKLKTLSVSFLVLVLLVLVLTRGNPVKNTGGGFFQQFTTQIASTKTATPATPTTPQTAATTTSLSSLIPSIPSILSH